MKKTISQKSLWTLILLLTCSALILLNLCASLLGERINTRLDMTVSGLYVLSDETLASLDTLPSETTLYVFAAETDYPSVYNEMLRRYAQRSPLLTVRYIDPMENPVLVSHFTQRGFTPSAGDLLVEGEKRLKLVAYADTYTANSDGAVTGITLEQQLTSALAYVHSTNTPRAVFTTGHNERPTASLHNLFAANNFSVETRAIAQEAMDAPEMLIIAAPTADFTEEDIAALRGYLAAGSKLMVFLSPEETVLPNLSAFLAEYGLAADGNLLFEPQAYSGSAPSNIIPMYAMHEINSYFADHPVYVVMPAASSLSIRRTDGSCAPLLMTTNAAYAKSGLHYTSSEKAESDVTGQFTVAALAGENVFLCGSRMIYADDLMASSSYANRIFLTRVVNALYTETSAVSIPAKHIKSEAMPIAAGQAKLLSVLIAVVLPALTLLCGICVVIKRRKAQ